MRTLESVSLTYKFDPTSSVCIGDVLAIPTLEILTNPVVGLLNSSVFVVVFP